MYHSEFKKEIITKPQIRLLLFFSGGISLRIWDELGIFDREVAIYRKLQSQGVHISFITYGDSTDQQYSSRIPGIHILCNRWGLPQTIYRRWLPILHAPSILKGNILKTHQIKGSEVALRSAKIFRKKLIARCGYLSSENTAFDFGSESIETKNARIFEKRLFSEADQIVVTTKLIQQTIIDRYNIPAMKITIIPNYVDTEIFRPAIKRIKKQKRICFVGRLDRGKNLSELFKAVHGLDVELIIIGDGYLTDELMNQARQLKLTVKFIGKVPNYELPKYLNSADLFILPSLIEGHPKALLEAMACGLPVIGSNIPSIRELITHRETGYLCGTTAGEIREAIIDVLGNSFLKEQISTRAKEYIDSNFSLVLIGEQEFLLLNKIMNR